MGGNNTCKACFTDCTATCKGCFKEADTNGGYSKKLLTDCCADPGLAAYSCLCPCLLQGQISQAQGRNCCSACVCTLGPALASYVPVVGMSCYISPIEHGVVEIGFTYIAPKVRGTGLNRGMKTLLLNHAFACGYRKVEFRVDTRNKRSMAAVLKLGAQQEGVLRKNRVTWTGYVRDTAVFGLLKEEWEQSHQEDN